MAKRNRYQKSQKKNKFSIVGKILKLLLVVANVLVALSLLLAFLSAYLPPSLSMTASYCGLAFPYLLIANLGFVVLWLQLNFIQ